jgi:hypothetical protein
MEWVVEVDDSYYQIGKERTERGYNYTATLLGPMNQDWEAVRLAEFGELTRPKTLSERLKQYKMRKHDCLTTRES